MANKMNQIRELRGRERSWSKLLFFSFLDVLACRDCVKDIPIFFFFNLRKRKEKGTSGVWILAVLLVLVSNTSTWPKSSSPCNIGFILRALQELVLPCDYSFCLPYIPHIYFLQWYLVVFVVSFFKLSLSGLNFQEIFF